jgi:hypothetical protein
MLIIKLFAGLLSLLILIPQVDSQGDATRDVWLESRTRLEARPTPKSPKPAPKPAVTSNPQITALGLGYTLFMINKSGQLVRANPSRGFSAGDRVCLLVEANRNGYVYVFSQEDNKAPRLLFPNSSVRGGNNSIQAHQTFWLPEEGEIEFDENPAKEQLIVVFSEKQIPNLNPSMKPEGVPVEEKIFQEMTQETAVRRGGRLDEGMVLTKGDRERGVKLNSKNPAPSFILLSQDQTQSRIVAKIELTHR